MIKINNLFKIDYQNIPVKEPINRIAFSQEDIEYKVKCIKIMQDLGMEVTIDKIGNICGTIPGKIHTDKSIICGSHTDSVDNGGQFDGPLGVYCALKTAEDIIKNGNNNSVNYKCIIYACEESTRFAGKACLGSKYLRGDDLDFDKIISREGISLYEIVQNYKTCLNNELEKNSCAPIKEVDKVIQNDEIITAIEGHIEQADELRKNGKRIGICTSITAPYRVKVDIKNIETAADFICNLNEEARKPENSSEYRVTIPEFSIKNDINSLDLEGKTLINLRCVGENNHSGATPNSKRKDSVYGMAKFINFASSNPDIQFLEVCTPNWGANQITNHCDIQLAIGKNISINQILDSYFKQVASSDLANVYFEKIDKINSKDKSNGLFLDIRQQIGMNTELSSDMIFDTMKDIVHRTHHNCYMNITSKGEPFKTNPDLVQAATKICKEKEIPYEVSRSWAGHDLATLTNNQNVRTLLLFCDNSGGSHNSEETTTLESIQALVEVESSLAQKELERANKLYSNQNYTSLDER